MQQDNDLNQSSKSTFNRMAEKQKSQGVVQWPSQNPDLNELKQVCKESNFLHDDTDKLQSTSSYCFNFLKHFSYFSREQNINATQLTENSSVFAAQLAAYCFHPPAGFFHFLRNKGLQRTCFSLFLNKLRILKNF